MASHDGYRNDNTALSGQTGSNRGVIPNWAIVAAPPQWQTETLFHDNYAEALGEGIDGGPRTQRDEAQAVNQPPGEFDGWLAAVPQDDFFGHLIILPREIDAGIVLATQVHTIDIYNAYKDEDRSLQAFVNNVDSGVLITNLPALPETIPSQASLLLTLNILTDGPPNISGTLDFSFDTENVELPIRGERAVLLSVEPVLPLVETLRSKTDVLTKRDETEQRRALRMVPRQIFGVTYQVEGFERSLLDAAIFDAQGRAFGIPLWFEPSILQVDVAASDTVVKVDSTRYANFEVGKLAMVWADSDDFEALEISATTPTTITFASPFTKPFTAGITRVMPVRAVYANQVIGGSSPPGDLRTLKVTFTSIDADVDHSDASAFSTFNSKVLLNEPNMMRGRMSESIERKLVVLDSETGLADLFSEADVSRRSQVKGFFSGDRQRLWEVRQLLHFLKGRTTSFYLPTFYPEFEVTQAITSGSSILRFRNFGYSGLIASRQPKDVIRLLKTDGTEVIRTVQSAIEIDDTEEQITVDSAWGVDAPLDEIDAIDYVEKVRMDSDDVKIVHESALGDARIEMPVKTVLE